MTESVGEQIKELYNKSGFSYEDEVQKFLSETWVLHGLCPVKRTCKAPNTGAGDVDLITYLRDDGFGVMQKTIFAWQCKRANSKIFLFNKNSELGVYGPASSVEVDTSGNVIMQNKGTMPKKNSDLLHALQQLHDARSQDGVKQLFCNKLNIQLSEVENIEWTIVTNAEFRTIKGESIKANFIRVEYMNNQYYVCKGRAGVKSLIIDECSSRL